MVLVTLGILTGSTCWILRCIVCLLGVICWVHRYTRPFRHLLVGLENSVGFYYQLHEGFDLLVYQWCAGISLHDQLFLCHGCCVLYSCLSLVVWGNASRSPWYAHICYWLGSSYHDRIDQPWSYWMLDAFVCERQTHFHIGCCGSPDDFSGPVQGTRFWLFPWVYTRQDHNIQGGHQFCWCVSLLCYNGHVDIFHREHLWYFIGIFRWWIHFMSTGCRQGTYFP